MESILTLPDERLRRIARSVERFDAELAAEAEALRRALEAPPGGVGIAAPQLGVSRRLVYVDCRAARRPCRNHGPLIMINPVVTAAEGRAIGREGCLSVPEWVGLVPRATRVTVRYRDLEGNARELEATGFEARVLQHEIDHLDGILFIDRVLSTRDLVRRMEAG